MQQFCCAEVMHACVGRPTAVGEEQGLQQGSQVHLSTWKGLLPDSASAPTQVKSSRAGFQSAPLNLEGLAAGLGQRAQLLHDSCIMEQGLQQGLPAHLSTWKGLPPDSASAPSFCMTAACLHGWMDAARTAVCGKGSTVIVLRACSSLTSCSICAGRSG